LICSSTNPPIFKTRARTASSSASNCFEVCSVIVGNAETPGEIDLKNYRLQSIDAMLHISFSRTVLTSERTHTVAPCQQGYICTTHGEQSVGHHADNLVDFCLHFHRPGYFHSVHVQDEVAVISREAAP